MQNTLFRLHVGEGHNSMLLIVAHIYREAPPYFFVVYLFIILYIFWSRRSDLSTATQRANSRIAQQPTALELMELSILFASVLHSFLKFAKKNVEETKKRGLLSYINANLLKLSEDC